jgi:hypothetical protein
MPNKVINCAVYRITEPRRRDARNRSVEFDLSSGKPLLLSIEKVLLVVELGKLVRKTHPIGVDKLNLVAKQVADIQ